MRYEDLQQFTAIMDDWIPKDASVAIAIADHYHYYNAGAHDIRLKVGQLVEKGGIAERTLHHKCKVDALIEETADGVPYYGIGYPIQLKGEPGAVVVILPPNYTSSKKEVPTFLTGRNEDTWKPVPIEKITHIESLQKKTWFYAEENGYSSVHTLKNLEERMPASFLRIHRSYIVHIPYIESISRDFSSGLLIQLKDGTELPVSQTYVNHVRKTLEF
ncbi:LytR/AlgR family response regulator transcription factor [Sporosarcina sp. CAU 1771]